jgi:hypothetical protein
MRRLLAPGCSASASIPVLLAIGCAGSLLTAGHARAATIAVPAGGSLQTAINAAQPGDVITLAPGATYIGNFVLPDKGPIDTDIVIRSAASDSVLPRAGIRMTPAYSAWLPKIKSPNTMPAVKTAAAAHNWKLMFLEFQANQSGYGEIIALGAGDSSQNQLSLVPHDLVIDRVYVHGDAALGQKRGVSLNSGDTAIINSYISGCKAVGQDSQAIQGHNGPGNYLIENNYLEGAGENFMLGGADPAIPGLVTSNVLFRRNHLSKPMAWRDPIAPTPQNVAAAIGSGSLAAGTYAYRVVTRMTVGQSIKAVSAPSVEVQASVAGGGAVVLTWSAVPGATDYLVYGRAPAAENVFWTTTSPTFTDTGAAGTAGTPAKATRWAVKNLFELKNARDVVVEGNVMENLWVADQTGYAIQLTPRNQNGGAPWTTVEEVTVRGNVLRHVAGGVNILGHDNVNPSQQTNHLVVRDNLFDDLTAEALGSGSRPVQLGDGPDAVTIDHNTIITTDSAIMYMYGGPASSPTRVTNSAYTNNMSCHNTYGINGSNYSPGTSAILAYMSDGLVSGNVLAGGTASRYPGGNLFPSIAGWQAEFVDYANGDYRLRPGSPFTGLGADITMVMAHAERALAGDVTDSPSAGPPGAPPPPLVIVTTALANGRVNEAYEATLAAAGGAGAKHWVLTSGKLPDGITMDESGRIAGIPTAAGTATFSVQVFDAQVPPAAASQFFSLAIAPTPVLIVTGTLPAGLVGVGYSTTLSATGGSGAYTWSGTGAMPPGLTVTADGRISGTPATPGTFTVTVQAVDTAFSQNLATQSLSIAVAAKIGITTTALTSGNVGSSYSAALTATGNTGPIEWSLAGGTLPAGLSLATTGRIDGRPTTLGTSTFTVRAVDAGLPANVATESFTVVVRAREIVLRTSAARLIGRGWTRVTDAEAANGSRVWNPDHSVAKLATASAAPAGWVEITFQAEAGVPYHLWLRASAERDLVSNDSVHVQFSGSVDVSGAATYRIGTTRSTSVILEDGLNAGVHGWGWQDNRYGEVAAPIYFEKSGSQTLRLQQREDGISIDQIVLSAGKYLSVAPGAAKDDTTIVPR